MTTEQIITQHIQSLEIQNRGYRKQLDTEKSDLLCRGLTRSIAENEVIIEVLKQSIPDDRLPEDLQAANKTLKEENDLWEKTNKALLKYNVDRDEEISILKNQNADLLKTNEILNKINKDYSDQIDELKAQIQMLVTNNRKK